MTEVEPINLHTHPLVIHNPSTSEEGNKIDREQKSEDDYLAVEKETTDDEVDDFVWV
jgi:hypothetical protein